MRSWLLLLVVVTLAACSSAPRRGSGPGDALISAANGARGPAAAGCHGRYAPAREDLSTRGDYTAGGLYKPGVSDSTPAEVPDVDCIAEPRIAAEPPSAHGNRSPYSVLGKDYRVLDTAADYDETGLASYYGQKFHGRKTSNHEVYDMYQFTAAHKTLPLPSFALVTNLDNGRDVIVRINDRGPFHEGRVIDLSYAAAVKLGITGRGTGRVQVRALHPDDPKLPALLAARGRGAGAVATTVATGVPTTIATGRPAAVGLSGMDQLVGGLPARAQGASAAAVAPTPATPVARPAVAAAKAAPSDPSLRYHVIPNTGEPASADRFQAWMQAQGVHVATGRPGIPAAAPVRPSATPAAPAARQVAVASASPVAASAGQDHRPSYSETAMAVLLQVASFASRDNAEKTVAKLVAAGIPTASLSDVIAGGRTLWRVRVGAADNAGADALAARIAGLGFSRPQVVRE
ncbi:septal ring lytic transglycosylase RlpA family protein [Pseudoxanthomonas spadix]|uniref:septal ring lytic transglycosylase RlpA family protein n=1 Tax=Pseudoxanthomonas spadix TaxID=415229 RepID=UPI000EFEF07E|nr:septal ring lytic transglycosylase RlpA family protein [Pseudoxanthomonas spadix]MBP3975716.1 septal ring lytic transglycosylase RlpA family protein [Pseudoxanthomonas spadix]RMW95252.1 septal ring lytic transglycosylase RlpA family protein [Pseudoxanthomonas spadix]